MDYEFVTESWLNGDITDGAQLCELKPPGFDYMNFPQVGRGGVGIAMVHKNTARVRAACHFAASNSMKYSSRQIAAMWK